MPFRVGPDITPLVVRARIALRLTRRELGEMFQASMRTAHRWEGGDAYPDVDQVLKLARAVFPRDVSLAAELAKEAGTTLQSMGLIATARAAAGGGAAAVPTSRPFPPIALMIDSVVLAGVVAAEGLTTTGATRQVVRDILQAGFSRAQGLGLTLEEVNDALAPPPAAKATPAKK